MSEIRFFAGRLARALAVIVGLFVVTFFLSRAVSNPVDVILPPGSSLQQRTELKHQLGLDKPILVQFGNYVSGVAHGDFGQSTWQQRPALAMVTHRIPASLLLASAAALVALAIGLTLGIIGGLRPGSLADRVSGTMSAMSVAIPDFWLGIMLILIFSVALGWFPTAGSGSLKYLVLPALTLSLRPAGRLARVAREAVIDEMRKDYVLAARARGMRTWQVLHRHVFKNIAVAATTILGYDFLFMFTGYAIGVEVVFNWPGVGRLAVDATLHEDVVLVSAIVLVTGLIVAIGNMLIDFMHAAIDRRVAN